MSGAPRRGTGLRIVVLGYVVRGPLGGMVWHLVQYLMGLAGLGHDVWFVEDSEDYPACYDPARGGIGTDPSYGLAFAAGTLGRIGFGARWAYHDAHAGRWHGPAAGRVPEIAGSADLLVNLCGLNPVRPWLAGIPARAYVDEDPAFTQARVLTEAWMRERVLEHTAFFTFAGNVGRADCRLPDDGLAWAPTRQPVALDALPVTPGRPAAAFTTVMQWESYPAREWNGVRLGMKAASFLPFLDLPRRVPAALELAIAGAAAPRALLAEHGWLVRDGPAVTRDLPAYLDYLDGSKAELGVAKHGYVVTRSGWFSERSVAYLATGRPVVVQDTGFSDWLPTGAGVLAFETADEARAAIEDVCARYAFHCRAAREVAEAYFDARRVLPPLVEAALEGRGAALKTPREDSRASRSRS